MQAETAASKIVNSGTPPLFLFQDLCSMTVVAPKPGMQSKMRAVSFSGPMRNGSRLAFLMLYLARLVEANPMHSVAASFQPSRATKSASANGCSLGMAVNKRGTCEICMPASASRQSTGNLHYAYADLNVGQASVVAAALALVSPTPGGGTRLKGIASGLEPGVTYQLHMNEDSDLSDGCSSTGSSWYDHAEDLPSQEADPLAAYKTPKVRLGDFGSVIADDNGIIYVDAEVPENIYYKLFQAEDAKPRALVLAKGASILKCGAVVKFEPLAAAAWLTSGPESEFSGAVYIYQDDPLSVTIEGCMGGLDPYSYHAFHIHEGSARDLSSCADVGRHYNPLKQNHGAASNSVYHRHLGDLGNLHFGRDGRAFFSSKQSYVFLWGAYSVLRRSFVVHQGFDDLGRVGDAGSLMSGNAGTGLGCGIILPSAWSEELQCSNYPRNTCV